MIPEEGNMAQSVQPATDRTFSEEQAIDLWNEVRSQPLLRTTDGEPFQVVTPGRRNHGPGPDFLDAVITSGLRGIQRGDLEVHTSANDWYLHGHHRDPAYNHVILHIAIRHPGHRPTRLASGACIPVTTLPFPPGEPSQVQASSTVYRTGNGTGEGGEHTCRKVTEAEAGAILDRAGEQRFLRKAAEWRARLDYAEPAQCFYEGILRALGYSHNTLPFSRLARLLPLRVVDSVRCSQPEQYRSLCLQALLLGSAGLLPSQGEAHSGSPACREEIEHCWRQLNRPQLLHCREFRFARIRPANSPVRRLMAFGNLLAHDSPSSLLSCCHSLLDRQPAPYTLEALLTGGGRERFGIGHERAADIILNTALPLLHAIADEPFAFLPVLACYQRYPRVSSNAILRHMTQQLYLDSRTVNSACRQQGLLFLYRRYCAEGRCIACPMTGV